MNNRIPKNIHFVWFQGFNDMSFPKDGNKYINMWAKKNPKWKIFRWDETKIAEFITNNYPQYYGCWKNLDKVVKKCDMARWLILHHYGGAYCDCDIAPIIPLDSFLSQDKIYYSNLTKNICFPPWHNKTFFPKEKDIIDFNSSDFDLFVPNEWFMVDDLKKNVIGNCFLMGIDKCDFYINYLDSCIYYKDSTVLESFGTWRLTRYIYSLSDKDRKGIFVLPPPYCVWGDFCEWTCSKDVQILDHKFLTNWADKHSEKGWLI